MISIQLIHFYEYLPIIVNTILGAYTCENAAQPKSARFQLANDCFNAVCLWNECAAI